MDTSLQKLAQLPLAIRNKLSSPEFLSVINGLEQKYQVKLTMILIKLAVRDLTAGDLSGYLTENFRITPAAADEIRESLKGLLRQINAYDLTPETSDYSQSSQPAAAPTSKSNSSFAFSINDEKEADGFRELTSGIERKDYSQLAQTAMSRFGFRETDEILQKRLYNITVARLRDVRDDLELREALIKGKKTGGLEFSGDQADTYIKIIKELLVGQVTKVEQKIGVGFSFPQAPPASRGPVSWEQKKQDDLKNKTSIAVSAAEAPKLTKLEPSQPVVLAEKLSVATRPSPDFENKTNLAKEKENKTLPMIEEEDGLPVIKFSSADDLMVKPKEVPLADQGLAARSAPAPKIEASRPEAAAWSRVKNLPPPRPAPYVNSRPPIPLAAKTSISSKPSLDDVKFTPKLVGPIEELELLTLIDFRRLGRTPLEMTAEIKERIELLEKESYSKRIHGIEAWQKSEVCRFYRMLGQMSLMEGRSIEEVIKTRQLAGKPTLSWEEFSAIMELNRNLRF